MAIGRIISELTDDTARTLSRGITKDSVEAIAKEKQRNAYLNALTNKKFEEHKNIIADEKIKGNDSYSTTMNVVSQNIGVGNPYSSFETRGNSIYNIQSAGIHDLKESLRSKYAGLYHDKETGDEMIRYLKDDGQIQNQELFSVVSTIGNQWKKTAEETRNLRNSAGGSVSSLEDWILPQSHNERKIKKVGEQKWADDIKPLLDIPRVEKEGNGNIEDILHTSYYNITHSEIKNPRNATMLAKRHDRGRVLHFKDGDSIIKYKDTYGNPDIFSTIDGTLRQQSKEIGMLQILGPDPQKNYERIKEILRKDGMGTVKEEILDSKWRTSTGIADSDSIIDTTDNLIAKTGSTFRSVEGASKLGSATISSITDIGNIILGARYRGLNDIKILGRGLGGLIQESFSGTKVGKNVENASRLGLLSEFANGNLANTRFAEVSTGWFQRRAENVIRASGLGSWTNNLRAGFGLELSGNIANDFGKEFKDLKYKKMLEEYGINKAEWDKIKKIAPIKVGKSKFIDVKKTVDKNHDLGYRLSEMINQEMDDFVVTPRSRIRAWTTGGLKKGTLGGESARALSMFRSFPISVMMLHFKRLMHINSLKGRVQYLTGVMVTGLVLGTITNWAKDIVAGKTPRDINRVEAIPEALQTGGSLGLFGDIFLADYNRFGQTLGNVVGGISFSALDDIGRTFGDVSKAAHGNPKKAIMNVFDRAKGYIPGQNLWYTRLAFQRGLVENIEKLISNNDFERKLRRQKRAMRLKGQKRIEL